MQQHAGAAQHDGEAIASTHSWLGRLGAWAADHRGPIAIAWCGVVLVLGALAPFADRVLSGAGWEALGSESVVARHALEADFPGRGTYALSVVVAGPSIEGPAMRATFARVSAVLGSDPAVSGVLAPRAGSTLSRDRGTAVVVGLAGATPDAMVKAAGRLKPRLVRLSAPGLAVRLTGPAAMWSDFNAANKAAMLKSELLSWPLTLALLLFAFGTLVAAGCTVVRDGARLLRAVERAAAIRLLSLPLRLGVDLARSVERRRG